LLFAIVYPFNAGDFETTFCRIGENITVWVNRWLVTFGWLVTRFWSAGLELSWHNT